MWVLAPPRQLAGPCCVSGVGRGDGRAGCVGDVPGVDSGWECVRYLAEHRGRLFPAEMFADMCLGEWAAVHGAADPYRGDHGAGPARHVELRDGPRTTL